MVRILSDTDALDTGGHRHTPYMTTPEVTRIDPQNVSAERTMLEEFLDFHRATLLRKCAGLDADQLRRRSCAPSALSLLGLVRHLTEVERGWFLRGVAGRDAPPLYDDDRRGGDFDDVDAADPAEAFAAYERALAESRAAAASAGLDDTFVSRRGTTFSVRWVYVHMIEEYARHNGHADLLRERIDGVTGE
jgi:uncharacterized damage-inducible protein DinB